VTKYGQLTSIQEVIYNGKAQPIIAMKELKKHSQFSEQEFKDAAKSEADVLKMMKQLNHQHFIQIIAYYEIDDGRYFLFPWAKYGNLRDYWRNQNPSLSQSDLEWFFSQLVGLAEAIQKLHDEGGCRHGDIKPQNILCFEDTCTSASRYRVRLVIADMGLAKVHKDATLLRNGETTTKAYTVMYSAPETEGTGIPRSRLYDIWSIGCTYLEFVIWLLFGSEGLSQFQNDIGGIGQRGTFYDVRTGQGRPTIVNPRVTNWVKHIQNDTRCSEDTALRRLIDLIADRLLIVPLPGPTHEPTEPKTPLTNLGSDPVPILVRGATFAPNDDQPVRATATEMHRTLRRIYVDVTSKRCKIMSEPTLVKGPPRSNDKLGLPSARAGAPGADIRNLVVR
jgi:serine/threonine protein kinase